MQVVTAAIMDEIDSAVRDLQQSQGAVSGNQWADADAYMQRCQVKLEKLRRDVTSQIKETHADAV